MIEDDPKNTKSEMEVMKLEIVSEKQLAEPRAHRK